jgi:hypothetical protein
LLKSLAEKFESVGVSKKQIEKRIQRALDAITPVQVVNLGNIYTSMKDGMSVADDWFEPEPETGIDKLKAAVEKRAAGAPEVPKPHEHTGKDAKAAPAPAPASQAGAALPELSEVSAKLVKAFRRATDIDMLQADATLIETLPEAEQERVREVYIERLEVLGVQ